MAIPALAAGMAPSAAAMTANAIGTVFTCSIRAPGSRRQQKAELDTLALTVSLPQGRAEHRWLCDVGFWESATGAYAWGAGAHLPKDGDQARIVPSWLDATRDGVFRDAT